MFYNFNRSSLFFFLFSFIIFCFVLFIYYFLKLTMYILIRIRLCGRVSVNKIFTQPIYGNKSTVFWPKICAHIQKWFACKHKKPTVNRYGKFQPQIFATNSHGKFPRQIFEYVMQKMVCSNPLCGRASHVQTKIKQVKVY